MDTVKYCSSNTFPGLHCPFQHVLVLPELGGSRLKKMQNPAMWHGMGTLCRTYTNLND